MLLFALLAAPSADAADEVTGSRTLLPEAGPTTHATLKGSVCFDEKKGCDEYSLELNNDGTIVDSMRRRGEYRFLDADGSKLELDFVDLGSVVLGGSGGEPDCWEDPGPGINPAIGQINVCVVVPHQVDNFDPGCYNPGTINIVTALPEEDGHWSAGRLTPDTPMWVQSLRYSVNTTTDFGEDGSCGSVGHSYQVFVGAADAPPPANPTILASGFVSANDLQEVNNHIIIDMPNDTFVDTDESIFVSVQMLWDGDDTVCRYVCSLDFETGLGYWSNAVSTPYSWQDLNDFNVSAPMVTAYGVRLYMQL